MSSDDGVRLGAAVCGVYVPWEEHDVYAAIGVSGPGANALSVHFLREKMYVGEGE